MKFSFCSTVAGPKIFVHPLLYFGNVKLISSNSCVPFSVFQRLFVTGSIARPKLFLIPTP